MLEVMKILILCFSLFFYISCEVLRVQFLSRHCDRTTEYTEEYLKKYPDTTNVNEILGISNGELSPLGHRECFILGNSIRERYLDKASGEFIKLISSQYQSDDYYFSSTPFDRTIISGYSIALGMFPNFKGKTIDIKEYKGNFSYPTGEQAVPFITKSKANSELFATNNCKKIVDKRHYTNFDDFYNKHLELFKNITEATGNEITNLLDFWHIFDLLKVLHFHELLPKEVEKLVWEDTWNVGNELFRLFYSSTTLENLGGSPFLEVLLSNIHEKKKKFYHFSGHQTSMIGVLSALGVLDIAGQEFLGKLPVYGAGIIFELHDDGIMKMFYKDGYNGDYKPFKLKDCDVNCPIDQFEKIVREIGISEDWCGECGGDAIGEKCLEQEKNNLLDRISQLESDKLDLKIKKDDAIKKGKTYIVLIIVFAVLIAVVCLLCGFILVGISIGCGAVNIILGLRKPKMEKEVNFSYDNMDDE